jgi:hypothetical protein
VVFTAGGPRRFTGYGAAVMVRRAGVERRAGRIWQLDEIVAKIARAALASCVLGIAL